eukprot:4270272-Pleurochrysis_carterae.AAC.3
MSPASGSSRLPFRSSSGFKRSSTDGLQKFALSRSSQWPCVIAVTRGPSTHTNLPLAPERRISLSVFACSRISEMRVRTSDVEI